MARNTEGQKLKVGLPIESK